MIDWNAVIWTVIAVIGGLVVLGLLVWLTAVVLITRTMRDDIRQPRSPFSNRWPR